MSKKASWIIVGTAAVLATIILLIKINQSATDLSIVELSGTQPENNTLEVAKENSTSFAHSVKKSLNNPKIGTLAKVFSEQCEMKLSENSTFQGFETFEDFVLYTEPVKINSDGSKTFIFHCGSGAYQTYQIPALYDEGKYIPLKVPSINEDGTSAESDTATFLIYHKITDTFSSNAGGNGAHTCWEEAEYKLVDKKLVLQKFTADWNCESEGDESKVMFDKNKQ